MKFNVYLLQFSLSSLMRKGAKTLFVFLLLTFLIFLLSSVLFISDAMKQELNGTLQSLPDITLQRLQAGKQINVPLNRVDALLEIEGVSAVIPRIWGYYYFKPAGVNFSVVGIDAFEQSYKESLQKIVDTHDVKALEKEDGMLVGKGVQKLLQSYHYQDFFNFITAEGKWKKMSIVGSFDSDVSLEANDMIVLPKKSAYEIFGMPRHEATDVVLRVANPEEIATVVRKINELYPDMRVITKEDIRVSYHNIFDYKSGFFLALFVVCAFTFFMIVYDKLSGLSSEERREIGVLKALGWSMDDILKERFYESFILCFGAFLLALALSMAYVFFFNAPLLNALFVGYSTLKPSFELPFYFNAPMVILLFFFSVPVYVGSVIIPSWRAAMLDADEVLR
ncbi:ABC transporter permease [Sulfurospirillum barnesii]|uniref:ABC-type transport system, involved in lipoprotein release, permease component n=1 Tax=Sulfurospirillum barnesii (strain ATCC 700032 / DSM 10660 / SES-3) TaxID=760154 RepID=I3Y0B6_SULBS|nr:FtsX-like permease family protein [Sulfurospirillum barnesii]AFL69640.1 ABC-type transport system, involved in lipoprotein release, permease component [Sulfurospirillum barnesii SES-3]